MKLSSIKIRLRNWRLVIYNVLYQCNDVCQTCWKKRLTNYWRIVMSKFKTSMAMLLVWSIMAWAHYDMSHKYETKIAELNAEILKSKDQGMMTVTAYTINKSECDNSPNQTATMSKPVPGQTIAVSRDKSNLLGKSVYIEGLGVWYVNDLLHPRYKNQLDMVVKNKEIAMAWGKRTRRVCVL